MVEAAGPDSERNHKSAGVSTAYFVPDIANHVPICRSIGIRESRSHRTVSKAMRSSKPSIVTGEAKRSDSR